MHCNDLTRYWVVKQEHLIKPRGNGLVTLRPAFVHFTNNENLDLCWVDVVCGKHIHGFPAMSIILWYLRL